MTGDRFGRRGLAAIAATLVLALVPAACGDDDEDEGGSDEAASVESVTLTADDISATEKTFELSATPTAETKFVEFVNEGDEPHVMIYARLGEGFTVDEANELEGRKGSAEIVAEAEARPGDTSEVNVKGPVEPGNYVMLCPIPGQGGEPHYKMGQLEEFTIE